MFILSLFSFFSKNVVRAKLSLIGKNTTSFTMKANKRGQDFKALELKVTEDTTSPHIIYFKEHSVREHTNDRPSGRTLFVLNIPPYVDTKGLTNAFSEVDNILSISFSQTPSFPNTENNNEFLPANQKFTFKIAYIVFEKVSSLDKALKLKHLRPLNYGNNDVKCGMKKWAEEYNTSIVTGKVLKGKVDEFMKLHDEKTKLVEEKEKRAEQKDDEGWVTVTKRGKVQSFARTEKVENKIMANEEKGKKRKELNNFYTFQIRESKMKHIVALRQKFEEDKKKIAQIKQSRKFKPF